MMKHGFTEEHAEGSRKPFPVAAQVSDVLLDKCEYSSSEKYEGIDFFFSRQIMGPNGKPITQHLKYKEFGVNEDTVKATPTETHEQAVEKAYKRSNEKLLHMAEAFGITRDELIGAVADTQTYQEFAVEYCKLLNHTSKGIKVWLKTLRDKGFVKLPNFPRFIQPMSDGQCSLAYSQWELNKLSTDTAPPNGVHEDSSEQEWAPSAADEETF